MSGPPLGDKETFMCGFRMQSRRPNFKKALGVTRTKKYLKDQLGITTVMKRVRAPGNAKWRALRKAGYYSRPAKHLRFFSRHH
jgi:hypothetical protein